MGDLAKSRMSSELFQNHINLANVLVNHIKSKRSLLFAIKVFQRTGSQMN